MNNDGISAVLSKSQFVILPLPEMVWERINKNKKKKKEEFKGKLARLAALSERAGSRVNAKCVKHFTHHVMGNNFPLAYLVFSQNVWHHQVLTCMRHEKMSDCVEKLWVSILFKTKQRALSLLMYTSER